MAYRTLIRAHQRLVHLAVVTLLGSLCIACTPKVEEPLKIQGFTQGTTYNISLYLPETSSVSQAQLEEAISKELAHIDQVFSNYRDDSVIEQFNNLQATDIVNTDAELVDLVKRARDIYIASHGCYDITSKPLFELWGFKKDVFNKPSDEEIAAALTIVGMDKLDIPSDTQLRKQVPELRIDSNSIAQGYSVERVVKLLENDFGIVSYLVEIGGELQVRGKKADGSAWRIGLDKPLPGERKLQKIVSFDAGEPMSLITSGTYRHYFDSEGKRYSHILDARVGKPVEHNTVSVAVIHPNPTLADGWSTALQCLGSGEGMEVAKANHLAVLFIDQHGDELREIKSPALEALQVITLNNP